MLLLPVASFAAPGKAVELRHSLGSSYLIYKDPRFVNSFTYDTGIFYLGGFRWSDNFSDRTRYHLSLQLLREPSIKPGINVTARQSGYTTINPSLQVERDFGMISLTLGYSALITGRRISRERDGEQIEKVYIENRLSQSYPVFALDIQVGEDIKAHFGFLDQDAHLLYGFLTMGMLFRLKEYWLGTAIGVLNHANFSGGRPDFLRPTSSLLVVTERHFENYFVRIRPGLVVFADKQMNAAVISFFDRLFIEVSLGYRF